MKNIMRMDDAITKAIRRGIELKNIIIVGTSGIYSSYHRALNDGKGVEFLIYITECTDRKNMLNHNCTYVLTHDSYGRYAEINLED